MTTSAAGSLRTLPAMKPQLTHDQCIRREADSLLEASGGTKCVVSLARRTVATLAEIALEQREKL